MRHTNLVPLLAVLLVVLALQAAGQPFERVPNRAVMPGKVTRVTETPLRDVGGQTLPKSYLGPALWIRGSFSALESDLPSALLAGGACLVTQSTSEIVECDDASACKQPPNDGSEAYCAPGPRPALGKWKKTCWYRPGPSPGNDYCNRGNEAIAARALYTPVVSALEFWDASVRWRVITCEHLVPPFENRKGELKAACANEDSIEGVHKRTQFGEPAEFRRESRTPPNSPQ